MLSLRSSWLIVAFALATLLLVGYGLWAIASLGITELYADQWRQYLAYLQQPFPASAFAADNGHRALFPSLIRLAELHWFEGNQRLQLLAGALFALLAWGLVVIVAWRDRALAPVQRWAVIVLAAFALFWLGNARMLLHGNEAGNVYLIALCLIASLVLVLRPATRSGTVLLACALGLVATFSFGPGLAVFVALALVLFVQRRPRMAALVLLAMVLTWLIYLVLPGGEGVRNTLALQPLANLHTAVTWLSSMWVHLLRPFIDLEIARGLPLHMNAIATPIASAYQALFGDPWRQTAPFAVIGWLGLAGLALCTWRAWRTRNLGDSTLLALGVAWFALGVAGIVALGRLDYFAQYPGQIFANRYVPWSCLFWFGLLAAALTVRANTASVTAPNRVPLSPPLLITLAIVPLALLTAIGFGQWSHIVQQLVRLNSAGFVAGVIDPEQTLGESLAVEVETGLPVVRAAGISAFAWPEARRLGQAVSASAIETGIAPVTIQVRAIGNRLGGAATRLDIVVSRRADIDMPARLLIAQGGRGLGVMVRQTTTPGWAYAGYVAQPVSGDQLQLLRLRDDGGIDCWAGCRPSAAP